MDFCLNRGATFQAAVPISSSCSLTSKDYRSVFAEIMISLLDMLFIITKVRGLQAYPLQPLNFLERFFISRIRHSMLNFIDYSQFSIEYLKVNEKKKKICAVLYGVRKYESKTLVNRIIKDVFYVATDIIKLFFFLN